MTAYREIPQHSRFNSTQSKTNRCTCARKATRVHLSVSTAFAYSCTWTRGRRRRIKHTCNYRCDWANRERDVDCGLVIASFAALQSSRLFRIICSTCTLVFEHMICNGLQRAAVVVSATICGVIIVLNRRGCIRAWNGNKLKTSCTRNANRS